MDADVLASFGGRAPLAGALLTALAWGRAPGLPWDDVWVPVASALAEAGAALPGRTGPGRTGPGSTVAVSDDDVRWLLRRAKRLVATAGGPGGRPVYRIADAGLAARLRGEDDPGRWPTWRAQAEDAVTRGLLSTLGPRDAPDWETAHPYLRACLATHAAAASPGTWEGIVSDPGFLAAADPGTLGPLLCLPRTSLLAGLVRTYQRARPLLGEDIHENSAYLREASSGWGAAAGLGGPATPGTGVRPWYRTHFAAVRPDQSIFALSSGHTAMISFVAFGHAQGRMLLASSCDDATVRVWDVMSGTPVGAPRIDHPGPVNSVAFGTTPAGEVILASGCVDGAVRLWDPLTGKPVREPLTGHTDWLWDLAFGTLKGEEGERLLLASASSDRTVRVWAPLTGEPVGGPLVGHASVVYSVAFGTTARGRLLLASCGWDATVRLWDPLTGQPVGEPMTGHASMVDSVAFGTTAQRRLLLASTGEDGTVRVWDPLTSTPVGEPIRAHTKDAIAVASGTTPAGDLVFASCGRDCTVRVWDPLTGTCLRTLTGHVGNVESVAMANAPDGRLLMASAGNDRLIRLWDPLAGAGGDPTVSSSDSVTAVAATGGGPWPALLASADGDQRIQVRALHTGSPVGGPLADYCGWVGALAFGVAQDGRTPGGRLLLATNGADYRVRVWDPLTGSRIGAPLTGHKDAVGALALGGGGTALLLASGSDDQTVRVWDPLTGAPVGEPLTGHTGWVSALAFVTVTGDGQGAGGRVLLASGSGDHTVRRWDLAAGSQVGDPLTGHDAPVRALAVGGTANGRPILASADESGAVWLWDPLTGRPLGRPLTGHTSWVSALAFVTVAGGGGRVLLASGGGDEAVRLWDPDTGSCVATLRRRCSVRCLAAAGPLLAVGDDEGVRVVTPDGLPSQPAPAARRRRSLVRRQPRADGTAYGQRQAQVP